jgi:predicted DNA-binding ribbon-helix-helix protein
MKSPIVKRSITIDGRKTSISLEDAFWSCLNEIAQAQGATVSQTVTEIDKSRQGANLSSAIRLFVLDRVRSQKVGATAGKRQPRISAAS